MIDIEQIKADIATHESEGRDMTVRKLLVAEIERLHAALQDISDYGGQRNMHSADKARVMWQTAYNTLRPADDDTALDAAGGE